jgi:hypothetical protein
MAREMSRNVQGAVAVLFVVMGLSFLATTVVLFVEFRDHDWFTIAAVHSHLFIFFPTFGILALCAFYMPACALLDLYWNQPPSIVRNGRLRFAFWTSLLVLVSVAIARALTGGDLPAVWWLTPATLAADRGEPAGCVSNPAAGQTLCLRHSILESVAEVRRVSQDRAGLSPFVRECRPDPLIEPPAELAQRRYCFVTKSMLSAGECCAAQTRFTIALTQMYANEPRHSITGVVHTALLPLKVFFLLMVLWIGILLALWRRTIEVRYAEYTGYIERGILIGAFAMLLWPISNHSFLQSSSLLYGRYGEGFYATLSPIMSGLFVMWTLLLVLFFFRREQRDIEAAGKIGGGFASLVFALKYNEIIDYGTRLFGSGANPIELGIMAVLLLACLVILYTASPISPKREVSGEGSSSAGG